GYDKKTVAQTAADFPGEPDSADDLPNVIVIMNEAFSDLRPLGPFTTNLPVTPFIDSLTENTRKGDLYVSVKGGNTANTEFEFLTGDSMAFLPSGSIPYQQYVKEDIPTLATHLKSLGYTAEAIHPYYASGWFRNSVYPRLGFDTATFLEDLRPLYTSQVLRSYYSDRALFDTVTKMVDGREDHSAPAFVFAVTMQNHGSYDEEFANFRPDVTVDGLEEYKRISAYLSLIRKTDQAFENLVNHYAASDEKTVILMFGDHQPNDSVIYKLLDQNGIAATTENLDAENRYITPYVLWANYDIGEAEAKDVSANYLSAVLCRTAGIPMDGYQEYLLDLCEDYPVVSARSVIRADGTHLTTEETSHALSDPASPLTRYRMMAYAHLFDKSGRPTEFYD
ncbi:MAG: LTA synthase family protein, partial [Clostridia bacterium]|nr:LTA synthase family protein [Clostridia bacterium]